MSPRSTSPLLSLLRRPPSVLFPLHFLYHTALHVRSVYVGTKYVGFSSRHQHWRQRRGKGGERGQTSPSSSFASGASPLLPPCPSKSVEITCRFGFISVECLSLHGLTSCLGCCCCCCCFLRRPLLSSIASVPGLVRPLQKLSLSPPFESAPHFPRMEEEGLCSDSLPPSSLFSLRPGSST